MLMTPEQIANLPYSGQGGESQAMTAADYKDNHFRPHGKICRWWKGYLAPEGTPGRTKAGRFYEEQVLASDVRVITQQAKTDVYGVDFGMQPKGSITISYLPDEIELARGDFVLFPTDVILGRSLIVRGKRVIQGQSATTDEFPHHFVQQIVSIRVNGNAAPESSYQIAQDSEESGIEWLDDVPAMGTIYAVDFRYAPLFFFLGQENRLRSRDIEGTRLMSTGVLSLQMVT